MKMEESCDCAKDANRNCYCSTLVHAAQAASLIWIRHAAMAKIWPGTLSPVIGAGC